MKSLPTMIADMLAVVPAPIALRRILGWSLPLMTEASACLEQLFADANDR
jgi:hypothetical protein